MLRPLMVGDGSTILGLGPSWHKKLLLTSAGTDALMRAQDFHLFERAMKKNKVD